MVVRNERQTTIEALPTVHDTVTEPNPVEIQIFPLPNPSLLFPLISLLRAGGRLDIEIPVPYHRHRTS